MKVKDAFLVWVKKKKKSQLFWIEAEFHCTPSSRSICLQPLMVSTTTKSTLAQIHTAWDGYLCKARYGQMLYHPGPCNEHFADSSSRTWLQKWILNADPACCKSYFWTGGNCQASECENEHVISHVCTFLPRERKLFQGKDIAIRNPEFFSSGNTHL